MNAHKAIQARLLAYGGLSALVSTRVYCDIIPSPATYPAVVYRVISETSDSGSTTNPTTNSALIQVESLAKTRMGTRAIALQVMLALNRWRQATSAGVSVDDCFFVTGIDMPIGNVSDVYMTQSDFRLHYRE